MDKKYYIVKAQAGCMGTTGSNNRLPGFYNHRCVADLVLKDIQKTAEKGEIFWVDWEWVVEF